MHLVSSSYESFVLNDGLLAFNSLIEKFGNSCFFGVITGGFGDCWFQCTFARTRALNHPSDKYVILIGDDQVSTSVAARLLSLNNITVVSIPRDGVYTFCYQQIPSLCNQTARWLPGLLRPLHAIWYPVLPILLSRNLIHPIDVYCFIFDIDHRTPIAKYITRDDERIGLSNELQARSLKPGRTAVFSPVQNTHSSNYNYSGGVFTLKQFLESIGFSVCVNSHGLSQSERDLYTQLGLACIKVEPCLTPLLIELCGLSIAPSTGVVEVIALTGVKVKQIHLVNISNTEATLSFDAGCVERVIQPHAEYCYHNVVHYLPLLAQPSQFEFIFSNQQILTLINKFLCS